MKGRVVLFTSVRVPAGGRGGAIGGEMVRNNVAGGTSASGAAPLRVRDKGETLAAKTPETTTATNKYVEKTLIWKDSEVWRSEEGIKESRMTGVPVWKRVEKIRVR